MSILVTGAPGCGKTTLVEYAKAQNDSRFVDADGVRHLCEWREMKTGKSIGYVTDQTEKSDDEWYAQYGWYWNHEGMKELLASNPDVVLCGSAENVTDYYGLFNKVVMLKKTEAELLHNLTSPDRANPFGKTPEQRKNLMNWQDYLLKEAERYNPVVLTGNDIARSYQAIIKLLV